MNTKVMFSSHKINWKTPQDFYDRLNQEFHFTFDPCPIVPTFDGLNVSWKKRNFCNPPYGRKIGLWIKKAFEESKQGKLVVLLIPSRTDTSWWHSYIMQAEEIRFIKGRLRFSNYSSSAPFPSCVVVFRGYKPHSNLFKSKMQGISKPKYTKKSKDKD